MVGGYVGGYIYCIVLKEVNRKFEWTNCIWTKLKIVEKIRATQLTQWFIIKLIIGSLGLFYVLPLCQYSFKLYVFPISFIISCNSLISYWRIIHSNLHLIFWFFFSFFFKSCRLITTGTYIPLIQHWIEFICELFLSYIWILFWIIIYFVNFISIYSSTLSLE